MDKDFDWAKYGNAFKLYYPTKKRADEVISYYKKHGDKVKRKAERVQLQHYGIYWHINVQDKVKSGAFAKKRVIKKSCKRK